jgi:23S rRNA pseudouridine2604 synthase
VATRKGADELIQKGYVYINGKKAILGDQVYQDDKIEVTNNKQKEDFVYYAYNKASGISTNPEVDTKDILQVTKFPKKVFPVGRLDKDSHGLIVMTNDGRITNRLLSPQFVHEKEYIVQTQKDFTDQFLATMQSGVRFDNFVSKPCKAWRKPKTKDTFHIILTEGKKRQIRRMCHALFHKVIDLQRIRVMNIEIDTLKPGQLREIKGKELDTFLTQLGIK